jgi:hypothetical protein
MLLSGSCRMKETMRTIELVTPGTPSHVTDRQKPSRSVRRASHSRSDVGAAFLASNAPKKPCQRQSGRNVANDEEVNLSCRRAVPLNQVGRDEEWNAFYNNEKREQTELPTLPSLIEPGFTIPSHSCWTQHLLEGVRGPPGKHESPLHSRRQDGRPLSPAITGAEDVA